MKFADTSQQPVVGPCKDRTASCAGFCKAIQCGNGDPIVLEGI